jgi:hypothetical protein
MLLLLLTHSLGTVYYILNTYTAKAMREQEVQHLLGEGGPCEISVDLLVTITDNFNDEKKLGEGAFGDVYEGVVEDTENHRQVRVAVKRGLTVCAATGMVLLELIISFGMVLLELITARVEAPRTCIVCFDDKSAGLDCETSRHHLICAKCAPQEVERILQEIQEPAQLARHREQGGRIKCVHPDCEAAYPEPALARVLSDELFRQYRAAQDAVVEQVR